MQTDPNLAAGVSTGFVEPGELVDGELRLVLDEFTPADPARGIVPAYQFVMSVGRHVVGRISLRVGDDEYLTRYAGHIGYGVDETHRGHRYAARSCRLLFALARAHGFRELWITCNPDNLASRRTCELAGGELTGVVELPTDTDMYRRGERLKCRYRIDLGRLED